MMEGSKRLKGIAADIFTLTETSELIDSTYQITKNF